MGGKLNTPIGSFFEKKSDSFLEKLHKLENLTVVKCFTKIFRSLPFQMSMVQNTTIFIKKTLSWVSKFFRGAIITNRHIYMATSGCIYF